MPRDMTHTARCCHGALYSVAQNQRAHTVSTTFLNVTECFAAQVLNRNFDTFANAMDNCVDEANTLNESLAAFADVSPAAAVRQPDQTPLRECRPSSVKSDVHARPRPTATHIIPGFPRARC